MANRDESRTASIVEPGRKQDSMKSRYLIPPTDDTPERTLIARRQRALRVTVSWWKAKDYKLMNYGKTIAPIGEVTAYAVVPQDIDWTPFLSWSAPKDTAPTRQRLEWWWPTLQPPSADIAKEMRQWCQQYGCPGTLLLWAKRLVGPPTSETPSATQVRHDRVGHLWQRHAYGVPLEDADEPGAYLAERFHHVQLLPPTFTKGREVTMLSPTAVAAFFAAPRDAYPSPTTADFWQQYREPTVELLRASHYLRDVAAAATSDKPLHHTAMAELKAGVSLSGSGWQAASLMHAYSLQREPKMVPCRECEKPFPLNGKQMFCKDTCENTYNQRRRRKK